MQILTVTHTVSALLRYGDMLLKQFNDPKHTVKQAQKYLNGKRMLSILINGP